MYPLELMCTGDQGLEVVWDRVGSRLSQRHHTSHLGDRRPPCIDHQGYGNKGTCST